MIRVRDVRPLHDRDWVALMEPQGHRFYVVCEWPRGKPQPTFSQHVERVRRTMDIAARRSAASSDGSIECFYHMIDGHWFGVAGVDHLAWSTAFRYNYLPV